MPQCWHRRKLPRTANNRVYRITHQHRNLAALSTRVPLARRESPLTWGGLVTTSRRASNVAQQHRAASAGAAWHPLKTVEVDALIGTRAVGDAARGTAQSGATQVTRLPLRSPRTLAARHHEDVSTRPQSTSVMRGWDTCAHPAVGTSSGAASRSSSSSARGGNTAFRTRNAAASATRRQAMQETGGTPRCGSVQVGPLSVNAGLPHHVASGHSCPRPSGASSLSCGPCGSRSPYSSSSGPRRYLRARNIYNAFVITERTMRSPRAGKSPVAAAQLGTSAMLRAKLVGRREGRPLAVLSERELLPNLAQDALFLCRG